MVKKCIICKAEPTPICSRTFHLFPKSESSRKKWVDVINVPKTPNFKTAYVCSDHFDKESFCFLDELLRKRKRLRPEAVPYKKNVNSSVRSAENVTKKSATIKMNDCEVSDVRKDESLKANANEKTELWKDNVSLTNSLNSEDSDVLKTSSSQSHQDEEIEICTVEVPLRNSPDFAESNEGPDDCSIETVSSFELQNESTSNNESNRKKRKKSFTDMRPQKRVRFMNGFKVDYICRYDFVNDAAWNRFLIFLSYQRSKTAAAHNRNSRKKRKIQSLKGVINTLDRKEEFNAADYLKDLPSHMIELLTRMKEHKRTAPFPASLKTFARTLHFHSPAAYEFVRRNFLNCLPCIQTLNSWICTKEYSPGIST